VSKINKKKIIKNPNDKHDNNIISKLHHNEPYTQFTKVISKLHHKEPLYTQFTFSKEVTMFNYMFSYIKVFPFI